MYPNLTKEIIKRSLKIPIQSIAVVGDGCATTRQLDLAIMSVGFKLSQDAIEYFNKRSAKAVKENALTILEAAKELVGDHVEHNAYFIDFPNNVPSTVEFWIGCIVDALYNSESAEKISYQLQNGVVNLLDLPKYGKYQHSYEELVAAHEQFIPSIKNKLKVLHLGQALREESVALYYSLAESPIPLNSGDLGLLRDLTNVCIACPQPTSIALRENRAIINLVRLNNGHELLVDTVTDILRLSCLLSDGDVTLLDSAKFKSFPRKTRLRLMQELDKVVKKIPNKLGDVNKHCEQWKRLGERIHVHEYVQYPYAQDVFAVARKDKKAYSIAGEIENAFSAGNINKSISLLEKFPGLLFRNLDRILRAASPAEIDNLIKSISKTVNVVPTRIILSVQEHLQNRLNQSEKRIFVNKKSTVWVTDDDRSLLNHEDIGKLFVIFEEEISNRIQPIENLVVDRKILEVAIPLSNKGKSDGFAIMPRGSMMPVPYNILRFFVYWKQKSERTDYDLSSIILDENFKLVNHLSYTNLKNIGGVHSGDITNAPKGASEFIDLNLSKIQGKYIIPSVNVYSGENFVDIEESFFGFMERTEEQKGRPFEPVTVKTKVDIRGRGNVALPIVFIKNNDGWTAKWLNIYLSGMPNMNCVENNKQSSTLLTKSIVERKYLYMDYIIKLLKKKAKVCSWYEGEEIKDNTVFIGIDPPEKIQNNKKNITIITLNNLQDIIPT